MLDEHFPPMVFEQDIAIYSFRYCELPITVLYVVSLDFRHDPVFLHTAMKQQKIAPWVMCSLEP